MQRIVQQLTNCTYSTPTSAVQVADYDDDVADDGKCLQCKCLTIICTVWAIILARVPSK